MTLAKKLKKSNIAIDVVSFGETELNTEKLGKFIETVNKGDRSHLVTVPAGVILSDALMMSDIFSSGGGGMGMGGGGGGGGGGGNDFAEYGGVNPDLDPELALVRHPPILRIAISRLCLRFLHDGPPRASFCTLIAFALPRIE